MENSQYKNQMDEWAKKKREEERKRQAEEARRKREEELRRQEEERRKREEEAQRKREEEQKRAEEQKKREEEARKFAQGNPGTQTYAEAVYGNKWRDKEQPTPQRRQTQKQEAVKADVPQPQGKTYTRILMDKVLAHKGDTGDPFLMELNRDRWEEEYKDGRTKAFQGMIGDYADKLLTGKAKPSEGLGKRANVRTAILPTRFCRGCGVIRN
ncbi:MAG: hypothetical protein VB081_08345 [Christensenella sp.]|uniref:hypothetical protein n=1 Tax=Christensenella sp. TaxID=1935934 RepID=UPI002B212546|nr:hypothetical protein [Christensenella sp.]MEA5003493.1 hypothetical protein [Christensenella sp.]